MSTAAESLKSFRARVDRLAQAPPAKPAGTDEERLRRAKRTFMRRIDGRMAVDLETCIHCGMCAEACHFYMATEDERYTPIYKVEPLRRFYRRELSPMRWLFRPFTRDVELDQLREWQELVYDACTGCGRCDMMCPMGINISDLIGVMRDGIAAACLEPQELRALDAEQREDNSVFGVTGDTLREMIAAHRLDVPVDKAKASIMVLTTAVDVLAFTDAFAALAKIMNRVGADWTVSTAAFEAANVGLISGDEALERVATRRIVEQAKACGAKTLVLPESGHAYQALRWEGANDVGAALPFEVLAVSEFLARELDAGRLKLGRANGRSVSYHDPCRLARHGGVFDEPRRLLEAMGIENRETDSNRRENLCCGGGCGEFVIRRAAPLRQKAFDLKRREFDKAGADAVVTSCSNCRHNLMTGAENAGWDKPIESLVETVAANLVD